MEEKKRVEIVCPKCGNNKIKKIEPVSFSTSITIIVVFGILYFVGHYTLCLIIFFIGIISLIVPFISNYTENKEVWRLECELCHDNFEIKRPNGDIIITNISASK